MSKSFLYLREWLVREQSLNAPSGMVILECIPSRSGMSMGVYDRGERLFTVNGCGFDRVGFALARFLEACFMSELKVFAQRQHEGGYGLRDSGEWCHSMRNSEGCAFNGLEWKYDLSKVHLQGATGVNSMIEVANAIGLSVHLSESKAGTLIIIEKKGQ